MNDIETNTRENFPYPKSDSETRSSEERWHLLGTRVPKAENRVLFSNAHRVRHYHHVNHQLIPTERLDGTLDQSTE